ncbi:MAG: TetR/AcrR family transcriptional regulator [Caulobacteraceae bacterium]|nr:TetR/AcrR family transcriptional regulator [Caulobacteraceae bacterium]
MAETLADTGPGPGHRVTRRGQATREILLNTTIKLVALNGYGATSIQAVLDDTGYSRGALLHQFPTRESLMVATAQTAMEQMLLAIEAGLLRYDSLLQGMRDFPTIMWRVQNELPARAFTEIQLASRWDLGLTDGLTRAMHAMDARLGAQITEFAQMHEIEDVTGLIDDLYLLITATQGLAIGRDLVADRTKTAAALTLLRDRFLGGIAQRMAPP